MWNEINFCIKFPLFKFSAFNGDCLLELLSSIDTQLFIFLNITIANPLFDFVMPIVTNKYVWIPIWIVVIVFMLWKGGKHGRWAVLLAIIAVSGTDLFAYRVMKKNIQRIRPCNVIEQTHLTVKRTKSYSMPSNHAANFFALATIFSFFYRRHKKWIFGLAALVAFSRVSVGVHFPFDITIGALLGFSIAAIILYIYQKFIALRH